MNKLNFAVAGCVISGLAFVMGCSGYDVASGNEETAPKVKRIDVEMYRILTPANDTVVWDADKCSLRNDGTFNCYYGYCSDDSSVEIVRTDDSREDELIIVRDTFYTNLNFGDNRKMDYIPYTEIPEFNRDSIAELLSTISAKKCSKVVSIVASYLLEAEGLPEGFEFRSDWKQPYEFSEGYSAVAEKSSAFSDESDIKSCKVWNNLIQWIDDGRVCHDFRLPERLAFANFDLFNIRITDLPDTTFTWKLIYHDQYGRGDTLNITTSTK